MPDIFISYRREDTSGYAGRLYDRISEHFGKDHVFMDVTAIEPGSDFANTIDKKVGECNSLIALIGRNWLTARDAQNQIRLAQPGDFVAHEISAALSRNIEVIPVLVGGAKMPAQEELPESLKMLSRRQALEISDARFVRDVDDLIEAIRTPAGAASTKSFHRMWPRIAAGLTIVAAIAAGIALLSSKTPKPPATAVVAPSTPPIVNAEAPPPPAKVEAPLSDKPPAIAVPARISGNWRAVMQKDTTKYEIYFTFEEVNGRLFGKAFYPTGEAGILNGTIAGGRISFITKHTPDFSDEEATITVEGHVSGDAIEVFTQDKDGYAKGVAHRVTKVAQPKVLSTG